MLRNTLRHRHPNLNRNTKLAINENTFENLVCEMATMVSRERWVSTLRPRQNGRRFADDTFKRIFLNENVRLSIKISLKFLPKGPINNPALVQIMAWRRPGDKPLSEPMMVRLLTHICVTRPQRVNQTSHYVQQWWLFSLMHAMRHCAATCISECIMTNSTRHSAVPL